MIEKIKLKYDKIVLAPCKNAKRHFYITHTYIYLETQKTTYIYSTNIWLIKNKIKFLFSKIYLWIMLGSFCI